jgi:DNA-binding PadR family transcriptional regulator
MACLIHLFHDRIVYMDRLVPDEVVLGLLKAQPTHGYDLLDYFRSPSALGRIWTMSTSQLYAVLKRLSNGGDIVGRVLEVPNAPDRVEYMVTDGGEKKLEAWMYDPCPSASIHRMRVLFLSRVFIANLLDAPLAGIISTQLASCYAQQKILIAERVGSRSAIEQLTLEFVINQLAAAIKWLNQSQFSIQIKPEGEEYQNNPLSNDNTHLHKSS